MITQRLLLAWVSAALLFGSVPACGFEDDAGSAPTEGASGGGQGGEGGQAMGDPQPHGGEAGHGGDGGTASASCDCGDDPDRVHVPLDCARRHGLLTTFDDDFQRLSSTPALGEPWWLWVGTCDGGYRRLEWSEALENAGQRTYTAEGELAYSSYGPYGGPDPVCGERDEHFGDFGIGENDPGQNCELCLAASSEGAGGEGAGGAGSDTVAPPRELPACPDLD